MLDALMNVSALIEEFMKLIADGSVEIYNEFSLQHELGVFLRTRLPDKKIQFERNVTFFGLEKRKFTKREIDISIFEEGSRRPQAAIELKYPRNGQHPEQMFSFCKDVAFLEELMEAGFDQGHFLVVAEDKLFYSGDKTGIYSFFRGGGPLHGKVTKPTGSKDTEVVISGSYEIQWHNIIAQTRYAHVTIKNGI